MDSREEGVRGRLESGAATLRVWRERIRGSNLFATLLALVGLALLTLLASRQPLGGSPLEPEPSAGSVQWWLRPVERNRFLRPDAPDTKTAQHDLHAIAFALKGENGWAVGRSGAILRTTDGGRSWSLQTWSPGPADDTGAGQRRSWLGLVTPAYAGAEPAPGAAQIAQQAPPMAQQRPPSGVEQQGPGRGVEALRPLSVTSSEIRLQGGVDHSYSVAIQGGLPPYKVTAMGSVPRGMSVRSVSVAQFLVTGGSEVSSNEEFSILVESADGQSVKIPVRIAAPARDPNPAPAQEKKPIVTETTKPPAVPQTPPTPLPPQKGAEQRPAPEAKKSTEVKAPPAQPQPFKPAPQGAPAPDLNDVHFLADGRRGWIVGNGSTILHTRDGGETWQAQQIEWSLDLHAVTFDAKGERGWAAGSGGHIIASADGGRTWKLQTGGGGALRSIVVYDGKTGWAVGDKGAILQTDDGLTWQARESKTEAALNSVSFIGSARRALVVGEDGTVIATADDGKTWQPHGFRAAGTLRAVLFNAPGQRGWAVGDDGTVATTQDGGARWEQRVFAPGTRLRAVAFTDDASRGVAVGDGFAIYTSHDGGASWLRAAHRQYPAPWFYLAALLLLGGVAAYYRSNHRKGLEQAGVRSITDKGESDEPIDSVEQDRLGFAPLVKGLAGYLRNRATLPPLTIAIDAPWGGGKSSVMRMLRTEMHAVGVRSVWFNAWHHQQEDLMLAALIESIRAQALPFWATRVGLRFRFRLLLRRIASHPFVSAVALSALVLALSHLLRDVVVWADRKPSDQRGWVEYAADSISAIWDSPDQSATADRHLLDKLLDGKLGEFTGGLLNAMFGAPEAFLYSAALAVLAGAIVTVFFFGFRSFPGSPAVLLATVASQFRLGQAQAQSTYRQRFRVHFADVCEALRPHTMLIFIDDLDRCAPDTTAEMLEAINYLVNSGPCFVVIGMARKIVVNQLALHFRGIAEAYTASDAPEPGAPAPATPAPAAAAPVSDAERARKYVHDYLRKLINLEVHVPQMTQERLFSLLDVALPAPESASETPSPQAKAGTWRAIAEAVESALSGRARAVAVTVLLLAAIGVVLLVAPGISRWDQTRIEKIRMERKTADERLNRIREAERKAAVALDFARGQEKRIASELFDKYRVAVAGLEFRLPIDPPSATQKGGSQRCAIAAAARPKQPLPPVALEDSDELFCWRETAAASRAVEAQLVQIRSALAGALAARERDLFDRVARELTKAQKSAEAAELLAGVVRALPAPPPETPASVPVAAATGTTVAGSAGGALRHSERDLAVYGFVFGILIWIALRAMIRRDSYVLHDQPQFKDALRIWSPLLTTERTFAVPRETKRFQNRARFYAMRLRNPAVRPGWLCRIGSRLDGEEPEKPDGRTSIAEEIIVALTAIHQVCPGLLIEKSSPLFSDPPDNRYAAVMDEVWKRIAAHNYRAGRENAPPFEYFLRNRREVLAFLAVAEEFEQEPDPVPTLKAAA